MRQPQLSGRSQLRAGGVSATRATDGIVCAQHAIGDHSEARQIYGGTRLAPAPLSTAAPLILYRHQSFQWNYAGCERAPPPTARCLNLSTRARGGQRGGRCLLASKTWSVWTPLQCSVDQSLCTAIFHKFVRRAADVRAAVHDCAHVRLSCGKASVL